MSHDFYWPRPAVIGFFKILTVYKFGESRGLT